MPLSCPRLYLYLYLHTITQYPVFPLPVSISVLTYYNTVPCITPACVCICTYILLHSTLYYPCLCLYLYLHIITPLYYPSSLPPLPTTPLYSDYNSGFGSLPASAYSQRHRDREEIKKITDVSTLSYSILSSCNLLSSSIPPYPILYST